MTNDLLDALAKPPPPPSELDELMSRDPLDLSAADIDSIIAYQRQQRAKRETGSNGRAKKPKPEATGTIDLAALLKATAPATKSTLPTVKPSASFRRI